MRKRVLLILAVIFGLYLVFSLSRQVYFLFKAKGRIGSAEQKLVQVQTEHDKLQRELEYRQSNEFLEAEARNRLGLAKEGETVVILPEKLQAEGKQSEDETTQKPSNLLRWLQRLF